MKDILTSLDKTQRNKLIVLSVSIIAIVAILATIIGYYIGSNKMYNTRLSDAAIERAISLDAECISKQEELNNIVAELKQQQTLLRQFNTYKNNHEEMENGLKDLRNTFAGLQNSISEMETQISAKQAELERLRGDILKAAGEPKTLISGDYIVGQDLPAGRYIVSGSSNFFVYTTSGQVYINTILGNGKYADGDYTATLTDGMTMHCSSRTTFTPVTNK